MVNGVLQATETTEVKQSSDEDGVAEHVSSVETLLCDETAVPSSLEEPEPWPGSFALPGLTSADWQKLQREDETIRRIIEFMESGTTISSKEKCERERK